jgi:hypothetical protein
MEFVDTVSKSSTRNRFENLEQQKIADIGVCPACSRREQEAVGQRGRQELLSSPRPRWIGPHGIMVCAERSVVWEAACVLK